MRNSVAKLRNKTWIILASIFALLIIATLLITILFIQQQTQNSTYQVLYSSLSNDNFYRVEVAEHLRAEVPGNIYSDVRLSGESLEVLLAGIDLTACSFYTLVSTGSMWFYAICMQGREGILFIDVTSIMQQQQQAMIYIAIIGVVGIFLTILGSLLLSNQLVKPTKLTVEMQKEMVLLRKKFTANASHELRTPLTMIKGGFEEVISHKEETIENQFQWFEMMGEGISRIDVLANELSILADLENEGAIPYRDIINVSECLEDFVHPWRELAEVRGVHFGLEIEPNLLMNTNIEKLQQLLTVFLNNAFEYVDEQGNIVVKAKANREQVKISVSNSGTGVPSEDLERIYEHFYRAGKANVKASGSGLGLTIAKEIVRQLDGKISIHSVANELTEIEVII